MTPALYDALKDSFSSSIRVCLPCKVKTFDAATQTCTLTPGVKDTNPRGEYVEIPVLVGVPVQFPGGSQFALTYHLEPGDEGLVVFADRDTDNWEQEGGVQAPLTPRQHHLADAMFVPGIRSEAHKLSEFKADAIVVGKQGDVGVRVTAGKVELGVKHSESATQPLLLGTAHKSAIDSFIDSLKTALNTVLATGANGGGPVVFGGLAALGTAIDAAKATFDAAQDKSTISFTK